MRNRVTWTLAAALASVTAVISARAFGNREGCRAYTPASGLLVAHAGGGLPEQFYANSRDAIDLAAKHGFRFIEMDFYERNGSLVIGHDEERLSALTLNQLAAWLHAHPSISLVTDIKTDNIAGLAIIRDAMGTGQVIPQIYQPAQLAPVKALGFKRVIFAERIGESRAWFPWVNSADLWAVTIPASKAEMAKRISRPVFLYTVNQPLDGVGLYTDCLVPQA